MDGWWVADLAVAAALLVAYLLVAARGGKTLDLLTAARLVLAAVAAVAGAKLIYIAATTADRALDPFGKEDRIYIIIGGLALIWVALADSYRELQSA